MDDVRTAPFAPPPAPVDDADGGSRGPRPDVPPPGPPPRSFTMRPAFFVLALAAGLLVVFSVGSILTSAPQPAPRVTDQSVAVPGTSLRAVVAGKLLAPIETPGQPPDNIVDAVTVPTGAHRVAVQDHTAGAGQYDQQVTFAVDAPAAQLITFYETELPRQGWQVESKGVPSHGTGYQVLGKQAGGDGFYWEMGATVAPTTFPPGSVAGVTQVTLRLFQVSDDD